MKEENRKKKKNQGTEIEARREEQKEEEKKRKEEKETRTPKRFISFLFPFKHIFHLLFSAYFSVLSSSICTMLPSHFTVLREKMLENSSSSPFAHQFRFNLILKFSHFLDFLDSLDFLIFCVCSVPVLSGIFLSHDPFSIKNCIKTAAQPISSRRTKHQYQQR